ncbi:NUDIX domain-containing protein [Kribbella sp. NPDC050241]|uniref:NUDIX domain-containing protein n=1 Tax=Kribbella sp. NPDC050241 TaxID=3364115 RepID=UPI00379256AE
MTDEVHFTARFPTKRMAADCLFTDPAGRLLVLDPPYKPTWDLPGGAVERDESPRRAAQREVQEELGLVVEPGALLTVDWVPRLGDFTEVVAFIFDGGVLTPSDIDRIALDPTEASTFRFVLLTEAEHLLDSNQYARVTAALNARTSTTAYLENGSPRL